MTRRRWIVVVGIILGLTTIAISSWKARLNAVRTITVTWQPGPGWPADLLDANPFVELETRILSAANNPTVSPLPIWTPIDTPPASVTTAVPILVDTAWQAQLSAGTAQFVGAGKVHFWKVEWNAAVKNVSWSDTAVTLPTTMTVSLIPGGPPQ